MRTAAAWLLVGALLVAPRAEAEAIKIGLLPVSGSGPTFIAQDKGYFAAEGLEVELVPFDAGQPVAVATVSGDIDVGNAGVTSALYTFAGQGALRILAGFAQDRPGFHADGILASNAAYQSGLTSLKQWSGHSVALTTIGSTFHYAVALLAEKYGVDTKALRPLPLQSLANVAASITGGQADTGLLTGNIATPLLERGGGKLLTWVGDEVNWQVAALWVTTKTANERRDLVERVLKALRRGAHDYAEAFIGPDGRPKEGPTTPAILAIMAKHMHQTPEQVKLSLSYIDADLRLDVADIRRQIAWFRSQGMLKEDVDADQAIDRRYAATER